MPKQNDASLPIASKSHLQTGPHALRKLEFLYLLWDPGLEPRNLGKEGTFSDKNQYFF